MKRCKILKLILILFVFFYSGTGTAQDVMGVSLVSRIFAGGSCEDVWIDGNTVLMTDGSFVRILDVSDPANITEISNILLPEWIRFLDVSGTYAYVTYGRNLQIIDITNQASPALLGIFELQDWITGISVAGDLVYVSMWRHLAVIDVLDKSNPVQAGIINVPYDLSGIAVSGSYAYCPSNGEWDGFDWINRGLRIFDISNPANPLPIGLFDSNSGVSSHLFVAGNIVYLPCHGDGLMLIDVTDPALPILASTYLSVPAGNAFEGVYVAGNNAYIANGGVFEIVDVTDPLNPLYLGSANHHYGGFNLAVSGNIACLASNENGMTIFNVSNTASPVIAGRFDTGGLPRSFAFSGSNMFVVRGIGGLHILDITNPAAPGFVSEYDPDNHMTKVAVVAPYAYVTGNMGFSIIDVTNPSTPLPASEYNFEDRRATDLYIDGNLAYVVFNGRWEGPIWLKPELHILDITDRANPVKLGGYVGAESISGIEVLGDYAYVSDYYAGLIILNVVDKANPYEVGQYPNYRARDIDFDGTHVYLPGEQRLGIIDVTDPSRPFAISDDWIYSGINIFLSGNYAYLAALDGLVVIDKTYPFNCVTVAYYRGMINAPSEVFFDGAYAYIISGGYGIMVLDVVPQPIDLPPAWYFDFTLAEGAEDVLLTVGVHEFAHEGFDPDRGEVELPPKPVAGIFDARFTGPSLGSGTTRDIRHNSIENDEWVIDIQRAAGGDVTVTWPDISAITGYFYLRDMEDGALGIDIDMKTTTTYTITNGAINQVKIVYNKFLLIDWNMNYPGGWDLAALGVMLPAQTYPSIFPGAVSAFGFNNGYYQAGVIHPGDGYWINLQGPVNQTVTGKAIEDVALSLPAGWSLIGSVSVQYPRASILEDPLGSILSVYGFDGGYIEELFDLYPGKGYWVNLATAANITISMASLPKQAAPPVKQPVEFITQIPIVLETDFGDRRLSLCVSDRDDIQELSRRFELPPLPPAGILDARFTKTGLNGFRSVIFREDVAENCVLRYSIPPDNKKLVLKWNKAGIDQGVFIISDGVEGMLFSEVDMSSTDRLDLTGKTIDKIFFKYCGGAEVIDDYALLPNYPNPFNPETSITYLLKESSRVRLEIYNVLGQLVKVLADESQPSGRYTVTWDGRDGRGIPVAGGIYIYRLTANEFTHTRKMILIK